MTEIVGPVDRVIVVGAGIAGLAAATRLSQAGVTCVVLEARDRIGGRLHTIDLAGTPVDPGGSWIHHPIGNPLTALCDSHGILRDPGDPIPSLSAYDQAERRRLGRDELEKDILTEADAFWDGIEALGFRLEPDATALDGIDAFIADRGHTGAVARRLRQELLAEVEADAADRADNESLRYVATDEVFEGDLFGDLPRDGYRSVIGALARGLDIRTGIEVSSVEVRGDSVHVGCADGSAESASHAVVTLPLSTASAVPALRLPALVR
ncbi:hypothetical protein CQY20_12540 [Mycolicibacterium agri]|uniref:Amine oxidase domain-containing protein n=1 Tax=Mycolicibacterium agri TaxID=36811 RepID=A0A2A7N3R2_MYCAG|nr:FAD-dependent oxidoreductase [Mycolicibacterium agri]PEG38536.1 hypothetical protein CQY20_12540 [Mycolicibacterium agri]GFG53616.1 hypothetical protein MAGR_50570 [Mycolicibacterium agri]